MGHGLRIPADLAAWHEWQRRRGRLRRLRGRLRRAPATVDELTVHRGGPDADICVVVDALHASMRTAVVEPLLRLPPERVIVVTPPGLELAWPGTPEHVPPADLSRALAGVTIVLGSGDYTEAGDAVWRATPRARTFVSQHGAVTPYAPPLPRATTLLSWTDADGAFWPSGRADVTARTVGSQLLWLAGTSPAPTSTGAGGPLTYLGQGHAAEISRARLAHAALTTCREHGAVYRPHPSERDVTSRAVLAAYERAGITVDRAGVPLVELEAPVVSVFSTGVLEAAARGREAWVDFPRPPAWLGEFWERYGMHRLGSDPTPAPALPEVEPAQRIAEIVRGAVS